MIAPMGDRVLLPNWLVIGAMKAGTTSLYNDFLAHPDVLLAKKKELAILANEMSEDWCVEQYEKWYPSIVNCSIVGEFSTQYTKRPTYEGVAERARSVLGGKVRIVYCIREPVARIVSQFQHESPHGQTLSDFSEAIRQDRRLIDFSRYYFQIEPWVKSFGHENIRVLVFEKYLEDRGAATQEICSFLGVRPVRLSSLVHEGANQSAGRPVITGYWAKLARSRLYRYWLRDKIPSRIRERAVRRVFQRAPYAKPVVTDQDSQFIMDSISSDTRKFLQLLSVKTYRDLLASDQTALRQIKLSC